MPIYTVHEPPHDDRDAGRGPDRFVFVRDGFHFWAFLLGPLWMLWRRLWLAFIGYVLLMAALIFAMRWLGLPDGAEFTVHLLLAVLIGLEAATLRRFTLRRRQWRELGVVSADNREAAERRFFDAWSSGGVDAYAPARTPAVSASFGAPPMRRGVAPGSDIVGLFPEPGTPR